MTETHKANRLIHSTSPYLLQHAYNPVDWHEWNAEALTKARAENKPILVSIGYSSCHWCHVMEREVFEKENIALIMNEGLVCIKVDREERPDIDAIYMEAVQAMGVNGGWPLNVFLTPDQKPFYGGTYYPPDQWVQVINGIRHAFVNKRNEINASADELTQMLKTQDTSHLKKVYSFTELKTEMNQQFAKLQSSFDQKWGGLDKAPKFVMPSVWLNMLRYYHLTKNGDALNQLLVTLRRVAWGGIYDQIGGGFARYSVDAYWFVPHFEKMLYDNAQLMSLYAEAYAVTKEDLFKRVVLETFEWLQTEMMHPNGGFYSALDADSEGEEGKFYVWKKDEVRQILKDEADLICEHFNIKDAGNWEHKNNILIQTQHESVLLNKYNLTDNAWRKKLSDARDKLLAFRDKRIRPGLDDKIITSWNAMMVVGLTDAYRYIGDERFLQTAIKTMKFIETELTDGKTLYRSYKTRRSATRAFLDDYAFVIQAAIKLYQVTFDEYWINKATLFTNEVMLNFFDSEDGLFFYTSRESESLIARRKEIFDNVIPSSNSVMMHNLFQLGNIIDKPEWKQSAEATTTPLAHLIISEPNYMSNWSMAYMEIKNQLAEVVITGPDANEFRAAFHLHYQPFALTMGTSLPASDLPLVKDKTNQKDNTTSIFVCFNKTCQRPVTSVEDALVQIGDLSD